ncbi:MAG: hypothetical protein Q9222_000796 [Ikaeria aurantiellina]
MSQWLREDDPSRYKEILNELRENSINTALTSVKYGPEQLDAVHKVHKWEQQIARCFPLIALQMQKLSAFEGITAMLDSAGTIQNARDPLFHSLEILTTKASQWHQDMHGLAALVELYHAQHCDAPLNEPDRMQVLWDHVGKRDTTIRVKTIVKAFSGVYRPEDILEGSAVQRELL